MQLASIFGPRADIKRDAELERVLALPRRQSATPELVQALSQWARKRPTNDNGEPNELRPQQCEALREIYELRGLFGPMRVGSGKTLVTLLAPTLLGSERPVLLVPASLREKTKREFVQYHRDWHVRLPRIVSYTELGHPRNEDLLLEIRPDLLMLDEAHHTRNLDATVTRRVRRAIDALKPVVATLSGTLITDKLMDSHHHAIWSLGTNAPVPLSQAEAERWSLAVDREVGLLKRVGAGALDTLPGGFHEFFRASRGVVPTAGQDCDAGIQIAAWMPTTPPALTDTIERVAASGMRPDGELLDEWELPDCLCQLALGFFYVWDPLPPDWWLNPRRGWRAYARAVLDEHLPGFDSESQIVAALDGHEKRRTDPPPTWRGDDFRVTRAESPSVRAVAPYAEDGRHLLAGWRAVREQFVPNTVPVWLSTSIIEQAAQAERGTLLWTRYRAAGNALERIGVPYYGGGTNPERATGTVALSISAHGTGKNLQKWHRWRVLTPMANADAWEQLIGRVHRKGQRADTIMGDVICTIPYHADVLGRVRTEARRISKASGFEHKLCLADWV